MTDSPTFFCGARFCKRTRFTMTCPLLLSDEERSEDFSLSRHCAGADSVVAAQLTPHTPSIWLDECPDRAAADYSSEPPDSWLRLVAGLRRDCPNLPSSAGWEAGNSIGAGGSWEFVNRRSVVRFHSPAPDISIT
jgi:hypothetical protein